MTNAYTLKNIKVNAAHKCILNIPKLIIPANQCVALLGANGAGKSSLLNLLAFTNRQNEGTIALFEQPIENTLTSEQRRKIAFVDQHPYLLPGSVEDNIKLSLTLQNVPKTQYRFLIKQALEQTQTSHLAAQQASSLSGGELKRVAIARAIAYQPDILLLDEPFSHLDNQHIQLLEEQLIHFSQQAGKTLIFSTHDRMQGISLAEETINLVNGKTTTAPLLNVFNGKLKNQQFNTANISISTNSKLKQALHIAIDPNQIIISTQRLESSMRNNFKGRLTLIAEEAETVRLTVNCGEQFHITISPESLLQLKLALGDTVYLSFKSTAVTLF